MKISIILILTVLLVLAVGAVGAMRIFLQLKSPAHSVNSEKTAALKDALNNGLMTKVDYEQASGQQARLVEAVQGQSRP